MGHIVPVKIYVSVFLALLTLTALTTGVAFLDLGPLNTVAALAIAVVKMLLVVLFFMHVRYSSHLTKIVLLAAVLWLAILITLTLADFSTRHWSPQPAPWSEARGLSFFSTPYALHRSPLPTSNLQSLTSSEVRSLRRRPSTVICLRHS